MKIVENVHYYDNNLLDIYLPENIKQCLVYIHGGGIESGDKKDNDYIFKQLADNGVLVFSLNYSLYPNTKFPKYIVECSHGIEYAFNYLKKNNINVDLYVSGSSAGAYIALMICFDENYLKNVDIDPLNIKGWYIDSAQTTTHFHVLSYEDKIPAFLQRIDYRSPLYFVNEKSKFTKMLLSYYSEDMHCREEQNSLLYKSVKVFNPNANIKIKKIPGNHCADLNTIDKNNSYLFTNIFLDFIHN